MFGPREWHEAAMLREIRDFASAHDAMPQSG
jgi:hypothetical protein